MGKLKFGFGLKKKKKKTQAEIWQDGAPPPPEPFDPDKYTRDAPYIEGDGYYDPDEVPSAPYEDESAERSYNRATLISQRSHPDYDPYKADYYIPSSNRRSQFDHSVLVQRQHDTKQAYDDESERTATYPEDPRQTYEQAVWKKERFNSEEPQPYDESEYSARSTESYPARHDYQYYGDLNDSRRERTSQDPQLSDINEDQERYFQQQEWNDTGSDHGRGGRSYGAKMVEMCDSMADGISEALSRFFQSASLFCKSCFWSRNSN